MVYFVKDKNHIKIMDITIIERSNIVIPCSNIGCINPVTPNTARILNILEPITLPIAIPLSPLRAATTAQ